MKQKMIYITDELFINLSNEHNASNLICQLLNSHYNKPKELLVVDTDVFDVMDKSVKIIAKEQATNKLRDAILSELSEDEKAKLEFEQ